MPERYSNPELRNFNFKRIYSAGLPVALDAHFGFVTTRVGQINLLDGSIVHDSTLIFDLNPDIGLISLNGEGGPIGQFKYYAEPAEN